MVKITTDIVSELEIFLSSGNFDKVYLLTDSNTRVKCLTLLSGLATDFTIITIDAGDINKNIGQVIKIWETLSQTGATRNSALINLGGGMVTDLGGFAAATFKRGIHVINVPTTLMSSVDAAIGGKTGINFMGLKNEIGSFHHPYCVLIDCRFLRSLDRENLLSGYAEMIKHGLISNEKYLNELMAFDILDECLDTGKLSRLVEASVVIKERIVEQDPKERGLRKALNFGHTTGHALESLSFKRGKPVLHGIAVATGMVCELYLSHKECGLRAGALKSVSRYIKGLYPYFLPGCGDYENLYELMTHDKKNEGNHICFTLLGGVGDIRINQEVSKELIFESFDFYREG
jgi:3-dehydroquinate synthase